MNQMRLLQSRRPVTTGRLAAFLLLGFTFGLVVGQCFMGTTHAILARGHSPAETSRPAMRIMQQQQGQQQEQVLAGLALESSTSRAGQQALATQQAGRGPIDSIHTLCPSNGSPYQNYQMRIAYATYKLILSMPGGSRHVAFTRILHRGSPDELMEEVPTFRAIPLQPQCDRHCSYPVSDRANAVRQFLEAAKKDASMIKAPWLYMIESDYVFMKPLEFSVPQDPAVQGYAFWFNYIQPWRHKEAVQKLFPSSAGKISDVVGTGPAPVLLQREHWEKLVPEWERLTAVIEADPAMVKELGWVREMYAFSAAAALTRVKLSLSHAPGSPFIVQLPIDDMLGNAHAYHYTQCTIYQTWVEGKNATTVWGFDKRFHMKPEDFLDIKPIPLPPDWKPRTFKFIEGKPVNKEVAAAVLHMILQMNRGIATLQPLPAAAKLQSSDSSTGLVVGAAAQGAAAATAS